MVMSAGKKGQRVFFDGESESEKRGKIGVRGFEPPAFPTRTERASQAALHPGT